MAWLLVHGMDVVDDMDIVDEIASMKSTVSMSSNCRALPEEAPMFALQFCAK